MSPVTQLKRRADDHLDEDEPTLKAVLNAIKDLHDAFPEGDLVGHRAYHESAIAAKKAEERFWVELKLDLAKKGAWGLMIIFTGLIISGLIAKFGLAVIQK
jgi:hypothetical protein